MIIQVASSLPSFKTLRFRPGLNVLLAQKQSGANDRQTRNGVGKTSFVDLIHFLLGGNFGTDHFLRQSELAAAAYSLSFDLAGKSVEVERSPASAKDFFIKQGDTADWPLQPRLHKKAGHLCVSLKEWRSVLGTLMFGVHNGDGADDVRFGPSFRSLFSYFARRQNDGGFAKPEKHGAEQQPWDQQVAITYLLGLDASIPQELQSVRQREKALAEFKKAAKEGAFGELVGKAADLRTKVTIHESRVARLREQLASFHVVPQYKDYETEADKLTSQLAELANENQADRELLSQLRESVATESPPRFVDVRRAYEEAGVTLPGLVVKRFEDVERFHKSIVENRRSHLQSEIDAAEQRILVRDQRMPTLDQRRAQIMGILKSGGALEHYSQLQSELARMESQLESLRNRFEATETLERKDTELKVDRDRLHKQLQDDHHEQREVIREATLIFEDLSSALYERAGSLTIRDTPNGPAFEVSIEASRSKGINSMQIFCFDMMLMELCLGRQQHRGPGFLIHDSHLFDGVDERQVARALEIGAARAEKRGFQYIVTLNEDAVPRHSFHAPFDFDSHVLDVRLTDATEDGGLFGLRFE